MKRNIFAICLSNDAKLDRELEQNLYSHMPDIPIYFMRDAKSMTSGYNEAVKTLELGEQPEDILMLIHNDARLHFDFNTIIPEYFDSITNAGVLGFVGSRGIGLDSRWWLGSPRFGGLIQGGFPAEDPCNLVFGPTTKQTLSGLGLEPVDAVDGYTMFITVEAFRKIGGFDEHFDKFHAYDADICMKARVAGLQNYVIDQKSQHYSGGSLAEPWPTENAKWVAKWKTYITTGRVA